jgi:hypothetical protein
MLGLLDCLLLVILIKNMVCSCVMDGGIVGHCKGTCSMECIDGEFVGHYERTCDCGFGGGFESHYGN